LGTKVIASARRAEKLIELKNKSPYPQNLITLPLDITDCNSIEIAIEKVKQLDRLDLVIHNAGIAQKGLVIENEMEVDRRIMETNYFGTVAFTKAIMPIYMKQGFGRFAIVSSFAGVMGIPGRSAYAASKHALHGFFESLKAENIRCKLHVSFILPGFINTEITAKGLCGNGRPYGKVETSHRLGMTASQCAKGIIKGLMKQNRRIVVGKIEVFLLSINSISPGLSQFIIKSHPMRRWRNLKSRIDRTFNFRLNPVLQQQ
jgi:short-subunit dehydrogenase